MIDFISVTENCTLSIINGWGFVKEEKSTQQMLNIVRKIGYADKMVCLMCDETTSTITK
jgi:hypothetical protein